MKGWVKVVSYLREVVGSTVAFLLGRDTQGQCLNELCFSWALDESFLAWEGPGSKPSSEFEQGES